MFPDGSVHAREIDEAALHVGVRELHAHRVADVQSLKSLDDPAFRERLPDARVVMVEGCGHLPHVEKAPLVARQVLDFLEGVRS